MITQVEVSHFKRFGEHEIIDLSGDVILLAGPNNSGKSTTLQAISAWNLTLQRWLAERGGKQSQKRISLTVDEFSAVPVREMNLLWQDRRTAEARETQRGKVTSKARPIIISLSGNDSISGDWKLAIEFLYANQKLIYARPVDVTHPEGSSPVIPPGARRLQVVHVPPFSGLETEEPFRDPGYRDRLLGQGRPGEFVRNLLWELWQQPDRQPWGNLTREIHNVFGCELLPPVYHATKQAFIVCEYRPVSRSGGRVPKLDIASAGSGFHQVLLLLAFFYVRPATTLLLDEPDAHLHFILQKEVFNHLQTVAAERGCQLIVATHAEALLDNTDPSSIQSFFKKPHRLQTRLQVKSLQSALHRLSNTDLLQGDHVGAVLYVEDETDAHLLTEWTNILQHPAQNFFKFPFIYPMGGAKLGEAKDHFNALRIAFPSIRGICLLDKDKGSGLELQDFPNGLTLLRWNRYEIENYLLNPEIIKRFLKQGNPLAPADGDQPALPTISAETIEQDLEKVDRAFARQGLANLDYLSNDVQSLRDLKASDLLVAILGDTHRRLAKRDLYLLARIMNPDEIHPNVISKLDAIASMLPAPVAEEGENSELVEDKDDA